MADWIHVVPVGDLFVHSNVDCVCGPETWLNDHGVWVVAHHSLDGREASEPDV